MDQIGLNGFKSSCFLLSIRCIFFLTVILGLYSYHGIDVACAMDQGAGRIIHVAGHIEVFTNKSGIWHKAMAGETLAQGDAIRTGADGWASVVLSDETMLQLGINSVIKLKTVAVHSGFGLRPIYQPVSDPSKSSQYQLEKGQLWLRNKNRGLPIHIDTPFVSAGIRGTELDIIITSNKTVISVIEGRILAENVLGTLNLTASEQVIALKGQPLTKHLLLTPEDSVQWTIPVYHLLQDKIHFLKSDDYHVLTSEMTKLEKQLSINSDQAGLLSETGYVLRDLGKTSAALKYFEKALEIEPDLDHAFLGMGWTYLDVHQPDKALNMFNKVKTPSAALLLGKSAGMFQKGSTIDSMALIEQGMREFPDNLPIQCFDIQVHIFLRDYQTATQKITALTERHPENPTLRIMDTLIKLATGKKKEALVSVEKSLEISPGSPFVHVLASYVHQAFFNLKEARKSNNNALSLDSGNSLALNNAAKLEFADGNTKEAFRMIEKAAEVDPANPDTQTLKGFILLARHDTQKAIHSFQTAIDKDAGSGDSHLGLSLAYMRLGNKQDAFYEIISAVALDPMRSIFLSYWAKMLYQDKRFDRALELLAQAEKLDPNDPTPHLYKSHILHDLKRSFEAVEELHDAMAKNDNRAVFRSRYLLDHDLAVKNTDLARIFKQIGMSEWGDKKAWEAVKYNYDNSAAHDFLARDLELQSGGSGNTAASESLKAFLMKPANINTLNTFNDYTLFFEQPGIHGTLSGGAGNNGYYNADLNLHGAIPSINAAFQLQGTRAYSDGWRDENFEGIKQIDTSLKWDASENSTFSVKANFREREAGDSNTKTEYYAIPDKENKASDELVSASAGLYQRLTPDTSVMLYAKRQIDYEVKTTDHARAFVDPNYFQNWFRQELNEPNSTFQAFAYHRMEPHQFMMGTYQYMSDRKYQRTGELFLEFNDSLILIPSYYPDIHSDKPRRQQSYYIYDIMQVNKWLSLEAAIYYETTRDVNSYYSDITWSQEEINPRLGIRFSPTPNQTFSLGYIRYLDPFMAVERLDPVDIAGLAVPYYHEGSIIEMISAGWSYEWKSGCFIIQNSHFEPKFKFVDVDGATGNQIEKTYNNRYSFYGCAINQAILKTFGFAAGYTIFNFDKDEYNPDLQSNNQWIWASLTYHPSNGFSAKIYHSYYYSNYDNPSIASRNFSVTNASIEYELPNKIGKARFEVLNMFDSHFDGTWISDVATQIPDAQYRIGIEINF